MRLISAYKRYSSRAFLLSLGTACCLVLFVATAPGQASQNCSAALGLARAVQQGDGLPGELEVLSWNIQKAGNSGWARDLVDIAGDVNLAFIQEASVQAHIPDLLDATPYQNFAAGYSTPGRQTGVMTLSSTSPSLHCNFTSWEPWLGTPKATSVTEYPLAGRTERLLAINLHAVNFTFGLDDLERQLQSLAQLLEQHRGPVILAGDLNTWSGPRQALVNEFTGRFGLDAVAFSPDLRTTAFGQALDHIYIRGLRAQAARVVPVSSSDHNPLRVSLAFE